MSDKKKPYPKEEKPEMDMHEHDMEMPDMEMPMTGGMCPMMNGCPMMYPMMCPMMNGQMMQMQEAPDQRMEYMRSPEWYDEEDYDESSEESDEYPGFWIQKKKHKYPPYPYFWPPFYPMKPYKKKYKKW